MATPAHEQDALWGPGMGLAAQNGLDSSPDLACPDIDFTEPRLAGGDPLDKAPRVPIGNLVQRASDAPGHHLGLAGREIPDPDGGRVTQHVEEYGRLITPYMVSDSVQIPEQHFAVHPLHRKPPKASGGVGFDANYRKGSFSEDGRG